MELPMQAMEGKTTREEKLDRLKAILAEMGGVVIGYSGGTDSTFLAAVAREVLGDAALCVLASSETYPATEVAEAVETARGLGLRLIQIDTRELEDENFAANPPDRCFYCKKELFTKLKAIAEERGIRWVADGANLDDQNDWRPGSRAASELGVRSPLREAGLTKDDIRSLSRKMGLATWDKPSFACLSSRIPYGTRIVPEILERLDRAERFLRSLGFRQVRARHHDSMVRVEVEPDEIPRLVAPGVREVIVQEMERLGYLYVTLDLRGYRTGSMNAALGRAVAWEREV